MWQEECWTPVQDKSRGTQRVQRGGIHCLSQPPCSPSSITQVPVDLAAPAPPRQVLKAPRPLTVQGVRAPQVRREHRRAAQEVGLQ